MKMRILLLLLLCLLPIARAVEVPVSLIVEAQKDRVLKPNFAFELRFSEPMVADEAVARTDMASPLRIEPFMAGKWRWLSTQSGVFEPTEPPSLGTRFELSLFSELKSASGKGIRESFKETYSTPSFQMKGSNFLQFFPAQNASAQPKAMLLFNADVDPETLAPSIKFVGDNNLSVDARVRGVRSSDGVFPAYRSSDRSLQTWVRQIRDFLSGQTSAVSEGEVEEDDQNGEGPAPEFEPPQNQVVVSPVRPLPPGNNWRIAVLRGAPAKDGVLRLHEPAWITVGNVKPFEVSEVRAENLPLSGRKLSVSFNKLLHRSVRENPSKFVRITPEPGPLKVLWREESYSEDGALVVGGDFQLGVDYTVTISGEIAAAEPFVLGDSVRREVRFSPTEPRLYFEGFSEWQQRSGTRQFGLMSVNAPEIRVTARRIPKEQLVAAMGAYGGYGLENPEENERFQRIEPEKMPGNVVWQKRIHPNVPVDSRALTRLNWDEILGKDGTGAVFLSAEQPTTGGVGAKTAGTQALVQVTDLGAVWKVGREIFLHVFSLATAQPVESASIALLDAEGSPILQVRTAADGTVAIPKQDVLSRLRWLLISKGRDQLLLHFNSASGESEFREFRINDFGAERDIYWGGFPERETPRAFLFSDRPVYRPGELVRLKGIVRANDALNPIPSTGESGLLRMSDASGRIVSTRKIALSETGSFDAEIKLPAESVGEFGVQFQMGEAENASVAASCGLLVQDYVPNAFEVKISSPQSPALDVPMEFAINANYLMGRPLTTAKVVWSLRAKDTSFSPSGFEGFNFTDALFDYRLQGKILGETRFSTSGRSNVGTEGSLNVGLKVPANPRLPQPRQMRLLAEVTDLNQQTVSERLDLTVHPSDFYLGIAQFPEILREGEMLPLQLVAVQTDGIPVSEPVEVDVQISRVDWQTNRVKDADDAENFRSELLLEPVGETRLRTSEVVRNQDKWGLVDPEKKDTSFALEKPGLYVVTLSAKDKAGRAVVTKAAVHVATKDKQQLTWNYRNNFQVELVPDKLEYSVGESATVLVKTPISGPALVTVERSGVQRYFFTRLEGGAPTVRIPLQEADAPNVYVSVAFLRGSRASPKKLRMPEYRIGYTQLRIASPDSKLTVQLNTARAEYQPGEQAELVCEVRDASGKPVSEAEVTVWAADEGVLSLTGFETPNPGAFFGADRPLQVRTGLTIAKLLREGDDDLPESLFENKGYLVGGFGKGGEGAVRRNFLGTAFWAPALRTDREGRVRVSFKVPDGLTRYRLMAVAHRKGNQFGRTESAFEIKKPVMIEAAAPRFAHVGDRLVLRGVLHNTTGVSGQATVRLQLDEKASADSTEQIVRLPANGSGTVDFPVEVNESGGVEWTLSAQFTGAGGEQFRDAVLVRFNASSPIPLLREVQHKRLNGAESNLLATIDPALLSGRGMVRVRVANSRIFELHEGVEQLLRYPYGCVEQSASALLPWLALRGFEALFPSLGSEREVVLEKGVSRILSMQTPGGGLSYWPGGYAPSFWGSAYAGLALVMAKEAGVPMREDKFNRLMKYLSDSLRGAADSNKKWELSPRVLACYTLARAGQPEAAYHEVLFKKREHLSMESRALLALAALETAGGKEMAGSLLQSARGENLEEDFWFGSVPRAKGVLLLAWAGLDPTSSNAEKLANELLEARSGGHWRTTQGNAWAVLALSEYVRKTESDRRQAVGALVSGGETVPFELAAEGALFEKEFSLEKAGAIGLKNPSGNTLGVQVSVEARTETLASQRRDRGYSVVRSYQRISDDDSLSPLGEAQVGDRVLVTLEVRVPERASYLAIDDPLPSVFEAVNPRFKSQAAAGVERVRAFAADYSEIRPERVLFFADSIGPGKHQFRYLARVRAVGSAKAPPTKVEEMYRPDHFGLGLPGTVKSTNTP